MLLWVLQYVTRDSFVVGSSTGTVRLYKHSAGDLEAVNCWDKVHAFTTGGPAQLSLFFVDNASNSHDIFGSL